MSPPLDSRASNQSIRPSSTSAGVVAGGTAWFATTLKRRSSRGFTRLRWASATGGVVGRSLDATAGGSPRSPVEPLGRPHAASAKATWTRGRNLDFTVFLLWYQAAAGNDARRDSGCESARGTRRR